jgi:hypothetical protein
MAQDKRWALEATGPGGESERRDRGDRGDRRGPRRDRNAPAEA